MDDILQRFLDQAPVAVMVRAVLTHAFADSTLDALFDRVASAQYTKELTFSTLVQLMTQVVFTAQPSVHAAYRQRADVPVSVTAVYNKLGGLEPAVSAALVRETAQALYNIHAALTPPRRRCHRRLTPANRGRQLPGRHRASPPRPAWRWGGRPARHVLGRA